MIDKMNICERFLMWDIWTHLYTKLTFSPWRFTSSLQSNTRHDVENWIHFNTFIKRHSWFGGGEKKRCSRVVDEAPAVCPSVTLCPVQPCPVCVAVDRGPWSYSLNSSKSLWAAAPPLFAKNKPHHVVYRQYHSRAFSSIVSCGIVVVLVALIWQWFWRGREICEMYLYHFHEQSI